LIFSKLTILHHFVIYLSNDPHTSTKEVMYSSLFVC